MAGTRVSNYGAGDPNITALMVTNNLTFRGLCSVSLTNYDTTDEPEIAAGSVVEVGGTLYEFGADEAIGGSPADGLVYIKLIPSGASVTAEFTNDAPVWRDDLQGWYQSAISVNRYLPFEIFLSSTQYIKRVFRHDVNTNIAHFREEQASGTPGGGIASTNWFTRDLNTIVTNDIGISLLSNQITVPPGKYKVFASAPSYYVEDHRCALYNVSAASISLYGSNEFSPDSGVPTTSRSTINGIISLSVETVFELRHKVGVATNIPGNKGNPMSLGVNEYYSELIFEKIT
ncbi:MAG TPA: hypothetical protein VLM75_07520 [Spirochaetota bacterium]|nr:hypothetical protein [Spirochaetota bacterium]